MEQQQVSRWTAEADNFTSDRKKPLLGQARKIQRGRRNFTSHQPYSFTKQEKAGPGWGKTGEMEREMLV